MKIFQFFMFICFSHGFADLNELNRRVDVELNWVGYPDDWVTETEGVFDVAIVGGGMSGCSAAFALKKLGIHRLVIYDENPEGQEGPWATYGHMKVLRTGKCTVGPSLAFPSLTFQAWYEAIYGVDAWNCLDKATPEVWMEYLTWFRKILNLPVVNNVKVIKITRSTSHFQLHLSDGSISLAKKIVLATGRGGIGGIVVPGYAQNLSKSFVEHTFNLHDFQHLKGKSVIILGCGLSAFDAAGEALEVGAKRVTLLFRRSEVPTKNLLGGLVHAGAEQGFYELQDEQKCKLINAAIENGDPPPKEALKRVNSFNNFHLSPSTVILKIDLISNRLAINTNRGLIDADYLILATGFQIDLRQTREIEEIHDKIRTWRGHAMEKDLAQFPYLGAAFQFLPKLKQDRYVSDIYCFNYGALLSHGLITSTIDSISAGAERLAKGIATDFFLLEYPFFLESVYEESD